MKVLVNALLWYLLLQLAVLWMLQRRASGRSRMLLQILFGASILLGVLSAPVTRKALEASLAIAPTAASTPPTYIFVLGGGYLAGATLEEDALIGESQRRVLHGVAVWKRFPQARLVFSGGAFIYQGIRGVDRMVRLMALSAQHMGVPESAILLEPRSPNTRMHPVEALTLPGVTPSQPIAVVTSGWHMRRARREFCSHFAQVQVYPLPSSVGLWGWQNFIPDADSLDANTVLIRELVGWLWYAVLRPQGQSSQC